MYIAIFAMLFVPSYRFIFSGKAGEIMSGSTLISNSWEQSRSVLFGAGDHTGSAIIFSRTLFSLIIVSAVLFLFSLAISIWGAVIALRCFLSDNEDVAERDRRVFCVFVPNRIILTLLSTLGLAIVALPYLMRPLYAFTYSQNVTVVLEAPDALIVGSVFSVAVIILSVICSYFEKSFDADIFKKDTDGEEDVEVTYSQEKNSADIDLESKERIRRLFDADKDTDGDDKK